MVEIKFILGIATDNKTFKEKINAKSGEEKAPNKTLPKSVVDFLKSGRGSERYGIGNKQGYKVILNINKSIDKITIKDLEDALSEKFYGVGVSIKSIIDAIREDILINSNDSDKKILDIMVKSLCRDDVDSNLEKVKQSVERERNRFIKRLCDWSITFEIELK